MSDRGASSEAPTWLEVLTTILLASAAVAAAWSSYQAARWTGEQAREFSAANASRVESSRAADLANAQTEIDVSIFMQWVDAHLLKEQELARFYEQRFRDEFRPAFDAWIATEPFVDQNAPPSPFAMPEYQLTSEREADELQATADAAAERARENIQRATNYVLGVVLFSIALFFAGVSTRLRVIRFRGIVLAVGCIVFLATAIWIATFPVSLSI